MVSLHPLHRTETAEPGPSCQPSSYKDAQVWKDLKAETGLASCADYLESCKDVRPDFKNRLKRLRNLPEDRVTADNIRRTNLQTSIVIYDLSKQENLPISLSLRRHCHSGTELIQALREPPDNICVQLVLWSSADYSLTQEMSDALVLGLKLDPKYLDEYEEMASMERMVHMSYHPRPMGFRTSQIKSIVGNGTIATLSQNFMPEAATAVPVLLVAFDRFSSHRDTLFGQVLDGVDQGKPPINRSARGESNFFGGTEIDDQGERGQLYARIVQDFIVQGRDATSSNAFLLLAATSPLLYFNAYRIQEVSSQAQHTYDELTRGKIRGYRDLDTEYKNLDKDLGREGLKLRRTLEEAENHVSQFFRYLGSEVDSDWSKQPSYVSIKADWRSLIYEARRLEKEIRNYMQLQVGNLSLEESRRSIELSNIQIRESKSVKIFTILAFIYVPINLATSIFGMNIQQLNQSGQNLWVFFMTAVVTLLVTGGSWLCYTSTSKGMAWYKERMVANMGEKKDYSLPVRIAMLVWLVRNGHTAWMFKSGAWVAILMNSKTPSKGKDLFDNEAACDYVSKYSQPRRNGQVVSRFRDHPQWSPLSK